MRRTVEKFFKAVPRDAGDLTGLLLLTFWYAR